jgi:hypothetical protein
LLQELLRAERELRLAGGDPPAPDKYLERVPEDHRAAKAAFAIEEDA